ncbi:MAG: hypothetical protein ACLGHE_06735 [Gammaproteobacteria bacterium]
MRTPSYLSALAFAALTLVSAPAAAVQDGSRPRLDQYTSYDEFLKAKVEWETRHGQPSTDNGAFATPAPVAAHPEPTTRPIPVPDGIDPTSETAPPPLAITGPEDLEVAVELAKDISHPDYKAPIRYNRTTHISFPLPSIDGSDMSQASIEGGLVASPAKDGKLDLLPPDSELTPLGETARPDGTTPETYAGMNLRPANGPSHVTVGSMN